MANSLHLGVNWCLPFAAFAALVALADFSSSDSALLANIESDTHHINEVVSSFNLGAIESDLDQILYSLGSRGNQQNSILDWIEYLETDTSQILSRLQNIDRTISHEGNNYYQNTYDSKVFQAVSALGAISNSVNALASHIDNITNYLCYSPQYSGAFTNFASFFQAYSWGSWANVEEEVRFLLEDILGRVPTEDEVTRATDLVYYNGSGTRFLAEYLSKINPEILPSTQWIPIIQQLRSWYQGSQKSTLQNMGPLYYYQYQTRDFYNDFLDYAYIVTNLVADMAASLTNLYDSTYITETTSPQGTKPGFSSTVVNMVGGLVDSSYSTDMVSTNVSGVITNAIDALQNESYAGELGDISQENGTDTHDLDSLQATIESHFQPLSGLADGQQDKDEFRFQFGSLTLQDKEYEIPDLVFRRAPETWYKIVTFFFAVLKIGAMVLTMYSIYNYITIEAVK